jgi:hypothetical protein
MNQMPLLPAVVPIERPKPPAKAVAAIPKEIANLLTSGDLALVAALRERLRASDISDVRVEAAAEATRTERLIRAHNKGPGACDRQAIFYLLAAVTLLRRREKSADTKVRKANRTR